MNPASLAQETYPDLLQKISDRLSGGKLISLVVSGSHAYGTNRKGSDIDLRGVFVNSSNEYFGMNWVDDVSISGVSDIELIGLRKFISLMTKCNPNKMEYLFMPRDCVIYETQIMKEVKNRRSLFVTKSLVTPFLGYAKSQYTRMVNMTEAGTRKLGKKRKELIDKYGYDTKQAMNVIRICREGVSLLTTGIMNVRCPYADELKQILNGKVKKEHVIHMMEHEMNQLRKAEEGSSLWDVPNVDHINKLCIRLTRQALSGD